jgi:hypothetical protein
MVIITMIIWKGEITAPIYFGIHNSQWNDVSLLCPPPPPSAWRQSRTEDTYFLNMFFVILLIPLIADNLF